MGELDKHDRGGGGGTTTTHTRRGSRTPCPSTRPCAGWWRGKAAGGHPGLPPRQPFGGTREQTVGTELHLGARERPAPPAQQVPPAGTGGTSFPAAPPARVGMLTGSQAPG